MARGKWTEAAFRRYPKRFATPDTVVEGKWLCHEPTRTWFEFGGLTDDKQIAVGFAFGEKDFYAPLAECYHSWDPNVDGL